MTVSRDSVWISGKDRNEEENPGKYFKVIPFLSEIQHSLLLPGSFQDPHGHWNNPKTRHWFRYLSAQYFLPLTQFISLFIHCP